MDDRNNFFRKNWLSLILLVLLGGACLMWMEEKKKNAAGKTEVADSVASAPTQYADTISLDGVAEEAATQVEADPLTDAPVVRLRPKLVKGPACMVENTFESYYPRNVIDGNKATAWGLESYQGSSGTFVFRMPCRRLDHIVVWNGNWGEMGAWEDNARVRRLTISKKNAAGERVEIGSFALTNRHQSQTLRFDFDNQQTRDIETLIVTASGRHKGILFQDLYLAELIFYGNI